jgi:hypothetical protein
MFHALPVDVLASKYLTELISAADDRRGACRGGHHSCMWRKVAAVFISANGACLPAPT